MTFREIHSSGVFAYYFAIFRLGYDLDYTITYCCLSVSVLCLGRGLPRIPGRSRYLWENPE